MLPSVPDSTRGVGEAAVLVALSFGWFILLSVSAVFNGVPVSAGFSDAALTGMVLTELACGTMALLFLHYRTYPVRGLLPSPNWRSSLEGVVLCAAALLACTLVDMLIPSDQDAMQPIAQIMANSRPSPGVVLIISLVNGLYEETFLLGYLQRAFASAGASFAIGLSVLVRLLYHLYQGPNGAVSVVVFGVVLGYVYWRTGRLWPAIVAHALADMLALA